MVNLVLFLYQITYIYIKFCIKLPLPLLIKREVKRKEIKRLNIVYCLLHS